MTRASNGAAIGNLTAAAYTIPTDSPEADGTMAWTSTTLVVVEVEGGGKTGLGYTYTDASVTHLIDRKLAEVVEGRDVLDPPGAWRAMQRAVRNMGREGLAATAISAIDTALWDLKAKLLDLPLALLLGRYREAVPIYGSGGFTTYSDGQLRDQLSGWVERDGCRWVKMKVGTDPAAGLHLDQVVSAIDGLAGAAKKRGAHRRKRPRRPLPGMMLHQDGSRHVWVGGLDAMDLIVTMDDATNVIYSAFLLPEEGNWLDVPGFAGSVRCAWPAVEPVHRSLQSLFLLPHGRGQSRPQATDAGWAGAGAFGCGGFAVSAAVWLGSGHSKVRGIRDGLDAFRQAAVRTVEHGSVDAFMAGANGFYCSLAQQAGDAANQSTRGGQDVVREDRVGQARRAPKWLVAARRSPAISDSRSRRTASAVM